MCLFFFTYNMSNCPGAAVGPLPSRHLRVIVVIPKLQLLRWQRFEAFRQGYIRTCGLASALILVAGRFVWGRGCVTQGLAGLRVH
ncbi:unnamed protein product [Sphagnum balticum]